VAARRRNPSHPSGTAGAKELKRLSNAVDRIARNAERLTDALARLERSQPRPPARRRTAGATAASRKK
jgi:hypothetical protein